MTLVKSTIRTAVAVVVALSMALGMTAVVVATSPGTAVADSCYAWPRTLRRGMTGTDVRNLHVRVAGWAGCRNVVDVDGVFGAETEAAVRRFQAGYRLGVDGVAGPQTFAKIYELQDTDCTPVHFAYPEFYAHDGSGFSGGKVSPSTVQANLLRVMWKLEALRRQLGDKPLTIVSGFRSIAHNRAVGGSSSS